MVIASLVVSFRAAWPWIIGSLAATLLLSGLDDLVPVLICFANRHFRNKDSEETPGAMSGDERSIAIFIPCWRESEVIEKMIRHNLAAIRYRNFAFFIGIYPNDEATVTVTRQLASLFRNVHVAECPTPDQHRRLIASTGSINGCFCTRSRAAVDSTPWCYTMPKT